MSSKNFVVCIIHPGWVMIGYGCIFEVPLDIQSVLSKRALKVTPLYSSLKVRGDEGGVSRRMRI
jgi:hypothetical protein